MFKGDFCAFAISAKISCDHLFNCTESGSTVLHTYNCTESGSTTIHTCRFRVGIKHSAYNCEYFLLSYDVASGVEITPCNKIDKPLVFYRFTGNVMTSITTLRT